MVQGSCRMSKSTNTGEKKKKNEEKVDQVRKFIWDMYTELREMRGKRKKIDIFAVEMTVMQLGMLANGMQKKEKESE